MYCRDISNNVCTCFCVRFSFVHYSMFHIYGEIVYHYYYLKDRIRNPYGYIYLNFLFEMMPPYHPFGWYEVQNEKKIFYQTMNLFTEFQFHLTTNNDKAWKINRNYIIAFEFEGKLILLLFLPNEPTGAKKRRRKDESGAGKENNQIEM